ncbi:MAG: prolipoprotein diacylglyceryl transferase, partial [Sphingomonadales bacterium]
MVLLSLLADASQYADHAIRFEDLGLRKGIDLGFMELRFYSLAYLAGIVLGYWHLTKMIKAPGSPMAQRHADDLFFYCTLGIIIGGRLGYAAFYTGGETGIPSMFTHFTAGQFPSWDLLRLWDGGMSFHGGLIGVLAAIAWVCRSGKINFLRTADYIAVNVPFGMMFGRIANFINGELWGRPVESDVPWAMSFPTDPLGLPRHPSQLYEAGLEGALLIVVMLLLFWKTRARWRPGLLVGVFTAGIALA